MQGCPGAALEQVDIAGRGWGVAGSRTQWDTVGLIIGLMGLEGHRAWHRAWHREEQDREGAALQGFCT